MRSFLAFVVFVGLSAAFVWQKHHAAPTVAETKSPTTATAKSATSSSTAQPAPPQQPSEHNWMKRSLDRATAVRDQARGQTQAAQNP